MKQTFKQTGKATDQFYSAVFIKFSSGKKIPNEGLLIIRWAWESDQYWDSQQIIRSIMTLKM